MRCLLFGLLMFSVVACESPGVVSRSPENKFDGVDRETKGSCEDRCGEEGEDCTCDATCGSLGVCCLDFAAYCFEAGEQVYPVPERFSAFRCETWFCPVFSSDDLSENASNKRFRFYGSTVFGIVENADRAVVQLGLLENIFGVLELPLWIEKQGHGWLALPQEEAEQLSKDLPTPIPIQQKYCVRESCPLRLTTNRSDSLTTLSQKTIPYGTVIDVLLVDSAQNIVVVEVGTYDHPTMWVGNIVDELGEAYYSDQPPKEEEEPFSPKDLLGFDDPVFEPEIMLAVLHAEEAEAFWECDYTRYTHKACAYVVYERLYRLFHEDLTRFGPYTFGAIMGIVFARELGIVRWEHPLALGIAQEAFARNLWHICYKDKEPGCNPSELLLHLSSKQAWYGRGMVPQYDVDYIEKSLPLFGKAREAMENPQWLEERKGDGHRPYDWGNWACNQPGYNEIGDGIVLGRRVPYVSRSCDHNASKPYDYYFGIVTYEQNLEMEPTSTGGGIGCPNPCTKRITVITVNP